MDQGTPHKTRDSETYRAESGEKPRRYGHRGKIPNRTEMACAIRLRIDKWDLIKLQSFCKAKDTVDRTKQQSTELGKKIFSNPASNKRLTSNIYKEFKMLESRKPNNLIKKMGYRAKQRILNCGILYS